MKLVRNEEGNVAVMFALMSVVVTGMTGMAVDYARALSARDHLQAAADSAAMAGVALASGTDQQRIATATAVFNANLKGFNLADLPVPVVTSANGAVTVTASGSIPTAFSALVGINSLSIAAEGNAAMSGQALEVALMIDLTGSMGATRNGATKISGLKDAAGDLLNIFFPGGATSSTTTRVAIAPFADYVNAGEYAATVTGLDAVGASSASGAASKLYSKRYNLKSTKQGSYTGTYTGLGGGGSGAGHGCTPPSGSGAGASGSVSAAGTTYTADHCTPSSLTVTTTVNLQWNNGSNGNLPIGRAASYGASGAVAGAYYDVPNVSYQSSTTGWYVPARFGGAVQSYNDGTNGSYPIGFKYKSDGSNVSSYTSGAVQGRFYKVDNNDWHDGRCYDCNTSALDYKSATYWNDGHYRNRYYVPVTSNVTSDNPVCDSAVDQPSGKLVTCVTERADTTNRYTDEYVTSGGFIGAYNQGNSGMSNYSEDGICYVAGRELPKVVPLTNQKSTLSDFFANATVGGGTPGHLGTAWAWYLVSPNWSSLWPSSSQPAAYTDKSTTKAVIIMTDGEYNEQYTSTSSAIQAAALCTAMKAKGIKVYTVGFGFANTTADTAAKTLLQTCASDSSSYFFPYDGPALRQAFKDIGNALSSTQKTARYTK